MLWRRWAGSWRFAPKANTSCVMCERPAARLKNPYLMMDTFPGQGAKARCHDMAWVRPGRALSALKRRHPARPYPSCRQACPRRPNLAFENNSVNGDRVNGYRHLWISLGVAGLIHDETLIPDFAF